MGVLSNLEILLPILLLGLAGVGFLIRRRITGDVFSEDQSSIEQTIRLKKLLETEGITLEEARRLRDEFRRTRGSLTKAEAEAIVSKTAEAEKFAEIEAVDDLGEEIKFGDTTIGMRARAGAEFEVLDSQLKYAVTEFAHECTAAREESLHRSQEAWEFFRAAEGEFAALAWEGGTGAPLLQVSRMIELTEQRIKDIRLAQAESNL